MLYLCLLSLLRNEPRGWPLRWCHYIHKRRNQKICNWAERETSQRSQNDWCDWLCKLGLFLKWCSGAHKPKSKKYLVSNRRFWHFLTKCNSIWKTCEYQSHSLIPIPESSMAQKKSGEWASDPHGLSLSLCSSLDEELLQCWVLQGSILLWGLSMIAYVETIAQIGTK